jgi:hypothetical protein
VTVLVEPVKLRFFHHELLVIVNALAPAFTVRFGAFDTFPVPPVPNCTVAVAAMLRVKPPVPVHVKLLAPANLSTIVPAVVAVSAIFPDPNATALGEA